MYRIGATSYVIPDHILPNVRHLGPLVDDVELVLFETDEHGSNLPDADTRARLAELAHTHGLSYTVHLPLDVLPGAAVGADCLVKAARVIDATRELAPFAYTLHLDGGLFAGGARDARMPPPGLAAWRDGAREALERVAAWVGDPRRLCIENVEAWDPVYFAPILEDLPISRTADIGHLWLRGHDATAALGAWLPRTRVVHLHGVAARDHASLAHVSPERLDPLVRLLDESFAGVVTMEVFADADLRSSLAALREARERLYRRSANG